MNLCSLPCLLSSVQSNNMVAGITHTRSVIRDRLRQQAQSRQTAAFCNLLLVVTFQYSCHILLIRRKSRNLVYIQKDELHKVVNTSSQKLLDERFRSYLPQIEISNGIDTFSTPCNTQWNNILPAVIYLKQVYSFSIIKVQVCY